MSETKSRAVPKDGRSRTWNLIVYPESAPSNWREILDDMHFQWIESPLHDSDINATGEPKKPHFHVTFVFEGKKSQEQIEDIVSELHCPRPQICLDVRGSVRYMAHMDNPEKFQYAPSGVVGHGGIDPKDYMMPSSSCRHQFIREMMQWCDEYGIVEFYDLLSYAAECKPDTWFPVLCDSNARLLEMYLRSKRNKGIQTAPPAYDQGDLP